MSPMIGVIAGSRRREGAANIILNGTFDSDANWNEFGYDGKSVAGGKAVFTSNGAYDGINQGPLTLVAGKYYELTFTISSYSSGNWYGYTYNSAGGGTTSGTQRSANGTYTERLLIASGANTLGMQSADVTATMQLDNVTLIGPYNTATVGGS